MQSINEGRKAEVTKADRERAEQVCKEVWGSGNANIRRAPMRLVEKIAEAIAEARFSSTPEGQLEFVRSMERSGGSEG